MKKGILDGKILTNRAESRPLGWVSAYEIPENIKITRDELRARFDEAGVDPSLMPPEIRPVDAFRRATREAEITGLKGPDNTRRNVLVREVVSSKDGVIRHLVDEIVDANNVRLSYGTVAQIRFDRSSSDLTSQSWGSDALIVDTLAKIAGLYDEYRRYYQGDHIRRTVSGILHGMSPTFMKSALYFVPEKYQEDLFKLRALCHLVSEECRFIVMPLYDAHDARAMIAENFQNQVKRHILSLSEQIRGEAPISETAAARIIEETKTLLAQVNEYEQVLRTNLSYLEADVEIVRAQIRAVLEKIA
ncbi:MAG: hypothetical protein NUW23_02420 [Firmicutes bacterium]|jgi:hypothetical protein|nr:hypothetical protein [Bacillota bacterium]